MTDYGLLAKQIVSLAEVDAHWLPVLSNAAALLWDALDDINWAGFYLVDPATVSGAESDAASGAASGAEPGAGSELDATPGAEPDVASSAHEPCTPELRLGPFQGKVACVRIPFGRVFICDRATRCAWDLSRERLPVFAFLLDGECAVRLRQQRQVSW